MRFLLYPSRTAAAAPTKATTATASSALTDHGGLTIERLTAEKVVLPEAAGKMTLIGTSAGSINPANGNVGMLRSNRNLIPLAPTRRVCDVGLSGGSPDSSIKATTGGLLRSWGQQCNPSCGCVIRMECIYNSDDPRRTLQHVTYSAKAVVVVASQPSQRWTGEGDASRDVHSALSANKGNRLIPVLTSKGRPMMKACTCPTLHHLAGEVVQHCQGKTWDRVRSDLEFTGVRSNASCFPHAVLAAHRLSVRDTHCFDVVEEAVTAMFKGFLLRPRSQDAHSQQSQHYHECQPPYVDETNRGQQAQHHHHQRDYDDAEETEDDYLIWNRQFFLWDQQRNYHDLERESKVDESILASLLRYHKVASFLAPASTLDMIDAQYAAAAAASTGLQQKRREQATGRSGGDHVADWIAHVDRLCQEN